MVHKTLKSKEIFNDLNSFSMITPLKFATCINHLNIIRLFILSNSIYILTKGW